MDPASIRISEEVSDALQAGRPVVALESALLSFGLPSPLNLETYVAMESAVREAGATPAGTAVLSGHLRLGLSSSDVDCLAAGNGCEKASLADLAWIAATNRPGATTVAATMAIAHAAGCSVFATGGIGGVHPQVAEDLDVSADLAALGRYPIAVISSGAKAILDIPKTLEVLEALGVSVIGLGTDQFPLFYSVSSGRAVRPVKDVAEAAAVVSRQQRLGLRAAVLVGNPVPTAFALDTREVQGWLDEAHARMRKEGVTGRARTPFLLAEVARLSSGRTVRTNQALLIDNARVAGHLAATLAATEGPRPRGVPGGGW
ncbi:MAG: pseudouridine-5'-phosphate glycosidase [Candidatus Riflebacteria bacterium]|nr:pseudouridine-5'-phosphate glycosidase [Candidatus Riflebacteria bacterium]